jgi:hypothetical protein
MMVMWLCEHSISCPYIASLCIQRVSFDKTNESVMPSAGLGATAGSVLSVLYRKPLITYVTGTAASWAICISFFGGLHFFHFRSILVSWQSARTTAIWPHLPQFDVCRSDTLFAFPVMHSAILKPSNQVSEPVQRASCFAPVQHCLVPCSLAGGHEDCQMP